MTTYATFADKDPRFRNYKFQDFAKLQSCLSDLKKDGHYFRGQRDAGWKLFTAAQREWDTRNLQRHFRTIHDFIEAHIEFQRQNANAQFIAQCPQVNDIAILSTMQHFVGPTPFLDFTTNTDAALLFATHGLQPPGKDDTSKWISIYAWKPGEGAATGSTNDLFNWERIVDRYGGLPAATEYRTLKGLSTLFIKQDTGLFLQATNDRLRRQGGLFLYSPAALLASKPYEELFEGVTAADVVDHYDGLFIPKMVCLDIDKSLAAQIAAHLQAHGVTWDALGLNTPDWSKDVYDAFLKTL